MAEKKPGRKKKNQRSDGRIQISCTIGRRDDGKPNRVYFYGKTRSEALKKKEDYLEKRRQGLTGEELTVREWVSLFKETYRTKVNPSYLKNDDVPYNRLCDALGDYLLSDIREADLQCALNATAGMSDSTISKYYSVIKRVFKKAKANKLIPDDPADGLEKVDGTRGTHRALEQWEVDLILSNWQIHRAGLWAMLMMLCGLRRSELMALRWENIDLVQRLIHVREVSVIDGNQTHIEVRAKSNAGLRSIPICDPLFAALSKTPEELRVGYVAYSANGRRLSARAFDRGWESICLRLERVLNGEPIDQRGVRWDKLSDEEKAKRLKNRKTFSIRPHDLRHTFATALYNAGVKVKDAQYYLGHSSIKMTMDLYTHLSEEQARASGIALVSFLDGWLVKHMDDGKDPVESRLTRCGKLLAAYEGRRGKNRGNAPAFDQQRTSKTHFTIAKMSKWCQPEAGKDIYSFSNEIYTRNVETFAPH